MKIDLYAEYSLKNYPIAPEDLCDGSCPFLYIVHNPMADIFKIGITSNPDRRLSELINQSGMDLQLLFILQLEPSYDEPARMIEEFLHKKYKHLKTFGEWFKLTARDIINIKNFLYAIEGHYIEDNIKGCLLKTNL